MIVDGNNSTQRNILINKCFYQTTVKLMHYFEQKGNADYANKTIEAIATYHDIIEKNKKINTTDDNDVFNTIDAAVRNVANKVFYTFGADSFNKAYASFCNYNYVQTVRGQLHKKK